MHAIASLDFANVKDCQRFPVPFGPVAEIVSNSPVKPLQSVDIDNTPEFYRSFVGWPMRAMHHHQDQEPFPCTFIAPQEVKAACRSRKGSLVLRM